MPEAENAVVNVADDSTEMAAGLAPEAVPMAGPHKVKDPEKSLALVLVRKDAAVRERQPFADRWERWRKLYMAEMTIPTDRKGLNNVFDAVLWEIAQTQLPRLMQAWFGERPLFPMNPRGDEDKDRCDAMGAFLQSQIDANLLDPSTSPWVQIDAAGMQFLHFGSLVMGVSWDPEKKRPVMDCGDIHDYLFDPVAVRGWKARYLIRLKKITLREIRERATPDPETGESFYDPEQVQRLLDGTSSGIGDGSNSSGASEANPDRQIENLPQDENLNRDSLSAAVKDAAREDKLFDCWEYWEPDRLIHILDGKIPARDGVSPYDLKEIPAWLVPLSALVDRLYGMGNAEIGEQLQYEINAKANQALDNVDLLLNPPLLVRRTSSFNPEEGKFQSGTPWLVDDIDSDVKLMHLPNYLLGTMQDREAVRVRLNQILGTTDYTKGQSGPDRIGVVVRLLIEQANARYGMMAQRFFEYGIRPWYKWTLALNLQFLGGDPASDSWEKTMAQEANPFKEVFAEEGTVENLMRDLIMPATYYTGSKALRAENFRSTMTDIFSNPMLAQFMNPQETIKEMLKLNDIAGIQRLMINPEHNEEQLIADENERLMLGETIAPRAGEQHQAHMQGHLALAATLESALEGMDPLLANAAQSALMVHLRATQALAQQETQQAAQVEPGPSAGEPAPVAPGPQPPGGQGPSRETEPIMDLERRASGTPAETGV